MSNKLFKGILIIALVVLAVLGLAACQDLYEAPEGYIEVERLTIDEANVRLSPSGDTSTYRLKVNILPENATNRALIYYVPSEYLQYIRVDDDGVVSAIQVTPEGMTIPLTVTSTTNKNAYLTVNVAVEYVPVERITFAQSELELMVGSGQYALEPLFEPSHAQDGREVTYTSLNPEIVSVDKDGVIEPVSAGTTHIIATSKPNTGELVEGRIRVKVKYAKGQYVLSCSDVAPQYNQIIGDFKSITFNLSVMSLNSDPDITILWYVAGEHISEADNAREYVHIPSGTSRTSYQVEARVSTRSESMQSFFSETITLFNPFKGFVFEYAGRSATRQGFNYGDEATFTLTESGTLVNNYAWYLRRLGESGLGRCVAAGLTASERSLTRRLDVEGDFVLTAVGYSAQGTAISRSEFEFGVTRYKAGDSVIVSNRLIDDGLPPESYNYYAYTCDGEGNKLTERQYIGTGVIGQPFGYRFEEAGNYIIACQAISDGVVASVGGQEYTLESELIRVDTDFSGERLLLDTAEFDRYRVNGNALNGMTIGGIAYGGGYRVLVKWQPVGGYNSYVAEVTDSNGKVKIFDSESSAVFGVNYVILPAEYSLTDKLIIRVKQKGGVFGEAKYYGYVGDGSSYFETVKPSLYEYLTPFDGVKMPLINDIEELGEVLNYIALYQPKDNPSIAYALEKSGEEFLDTFTFDIFLNFDEDERYPVDEEWEDRATERIFRAVMGANKVYMTGKYGFRFAAKGDGYTVTMQLYDTELTSTPAVALTPVQSPYYAQMPYGNANSDFAIKQYQSKRVTDVEQLYEALRLGYNPTIAGDQANTVYNKILRVVNSIIGPEMNDVQKVTAFYDWLTHNVAYDTGATDESKYYVSGGLSGVFDYNKAVCDGISKAFVALCAVEGIRAVRVTGTVGGEAHAWNKVYLNGAWYVVDATKGVIREGTTQTSDYGYCIIGDAEYAELEEVAEYGAFPVADGELIIIPR